MKFDDYQKLALTTALTDGDEFKDRMHWVLGLSGETGEIAEKMKKIVRDKGGVMNEADIQDLSKEIGDVLWYLAVLANHLSLSFDQIAKSNLAKLADRKQRSVIGGSGDNR
ncbi:MAG TPA: nucleoside triphosphate pyrophosphohydrolase family protein [Candidatus Binatia bacterium]|jgi:NTP pyrophosphatase (non-canonical NTP hydrolase)|nr:nucleoside triphosphate pyrophosphohydrolase family protein [Candidatus Binatia bacterium]